MALKAHEVFTPTDVPTVTYIDREEQNLEQQLRNSLKTPGLIISLSGPSKSGKTVLIKKVIKEDDLIAVSGAAIDSAEKLWERVLNWMGAPSEVTAGERRETGGEVSGKAAGEVGVVVASVELEGSVVGRHSKETSVERKTSRSGIDQVVREIAGSDFVVFVDDFHYMHKDVQSSVAKQIKEAAEKGVKICTASVPHRSDDVVRGNPELRGRVKAIDFSYWKEEETYEIARRGFAELNVELDEAVMKQFAREAFGSPQLMQQICLQACFLLGIDGRYTSSTKFDVLLPRLEKIFEQAATTTDFSSLLDALHAGPKQRGTTRTQFSFNDNSIGDVYRCILLALKESPPQLTFTYDDIYQRTRKVCREGAPPGSSVAQALEQIHIICGDIQPRERVVEWSEDVLDIVDPYFLYYLRCSPRITSLQKKQ